jgi:hypothetical protein
MKYLFAQPLFALAAAAYARVVADGLDEVGDFRAQSRCEFGELGMAVLQNVVQQASGNDDVRTACLAQESCDLDWMLDERRVTAVASLVGVRALSELIADQISEDA